jgi:hypothetical protein
MALGFMGAFIAYLFGYFFSCVPHVARRGQHRAGMTVDTTPAGPVGCKKRVQASKGNRNGRPEPAPDT